MASRLYHTAPQPLILTTVHQIQTIQASSKVNHVLCDEL